MSRIIFCVIGILTLFFLPVFEPLTVVDTVALSSSNPTFISLSYEFEKPTYNILNRFGMKLTGISLQNLPLISILGKPRLPVKPVRILLPPETTVKSISVETSSLKSIDISSFPPIEIGGSSHRLNQPLRSLIEDYYLPRFSTDLSYPDINYENMGVQYFRGYGILHVNLYPVKYLGFKHLINYFESMTINISTEPANHIPMFRNDGFQELIDKVENPKIISKYRQYKMDNDNFYFNSYDESIYDYVIITPELFAQQSDEYDYSFDDLINYRQSQGLSCTYKTVEEIILEYDGVDSQEKIRNFIKYAYNNWGTTWILLGGGIQHVPVRYLDDVDGLEPDETEVPSDLYYQCLDGSYNENGNDFWGEIDDGINGGMVDLYAEVYLGRAPVKNIADISAFVEKTLIYEQSEWEEDIYLRRHLSAGERVWDGPGGWGAGYVERCIDIWDDYNQLTHGIPSKKYDIIPLYERDASWTRNDVKDKINEGVNIINHVGHGNTYSAMKLNTNTVNELLNEGFYPFFYSQACHSGKLDETQECMASRWVTSDKRGGFAAIMNTGYGYGCIIDYDGANNRYAREFYDALYSPIEKITYIGVAHQKAKEDNFWRINENNMIHVYYDLMLFGCPYVSIKGSEDTIADFSWDLLYPITGQKISFTDRSSGSIQFRLWDFGDGTTSYSINPTHIYNHEGVFTVTLTVKDTDGYSSTINYYIDVRNYWEPIALPSPTYHYGSNLTVYFIGEESWDPDGYLTNYLWNFDDGTTSTEINPIHTYLSEGQYNVRFSVTDNDGHMDTVFCTIILSTLETPSIPIVSGPSNGYVGEQLQFSSISYDTQGDNLSYAWDFNDGKPIIWSEWLNANQTCNIVYNWSTQDVYNIRVKAKDEKGWESEWSEELEIQINESTIPIISLIRPDNGIYLFNKKIIPFFTSICIGNIDVSVDISGSNNIDRVVFYVDGQPKSEVLSPPYEWSWDKENIFKLRYKLKIVVYANSQLYETSEKTVWKI